MLALEAVAFAPGLPRLNPVVSSPTRLHNAMERLHDSTTNSFGPLEHVYSLAEIDSITRKIQDDEWMALGSAVAESLLETILDVCSDALKRMGWVERMNMTNKVADDVSKTVKVSRCNVLRVVIERAPRQQQNTLFYCSRNHSIPSDSNP